MICRHNKTSTKSLGKYSQCACGANAPLSLEPVVKSLLVAHKHSFVQAQDPCLTIVIPDLSHAARETRANIPRFAVPRSPRPEWPYLLWSVAATSFLLRPSAGMQRRLTLELQELAPFSVAVHVRHCDKGSEAYLRPLGVYLQALWDYVPGAAASIFVVTDNTTIYGQLDSLRAANLASKTNETSPASAPSTAQAQPAPARAPTDGTASDRIEDPSGVQTPRGTAADLGLHPRLQTASGASPDPTSRIPHAPFVSQSRSRTQGPGPPVAPFTFVYGNRSSRALRTCAWCGKPRSSGNDPCIHKHEERALLDLQIASHAPLAVFTWSSNYGHLLLDLQLFRHAFCSVALPVDNYFHAAGKGWAYLQTQGPVQGSGGTAVFHNATIVRTRSAKSSDRTLTRQTLPAETVASIASTAAEQTDPWAHGVSGVCRPHPYQATSGGVLCNSSGSKMNCRVPEQFYI